MVQGFGAVGRHATLALVARGAMVIAVSDSHGVTHDPDGLDIAELASFKEADGTVAEFPGGQADARDAILALSCDVLVPAGPGGRVHLRHCQPDTL
ncbi:hypothetical protein [Allosalinactinospora lopnorensis]|uniref:hypothetical protein n=1 Tax=Allosalinactinospora lopnorensis TaxID=1352348 RepID=UPI000696D415|nr:hypothetical protein [Allosalinactinospora lopnorensis]